MSILLGASSVLRRRTQAAGHPLPGALHPDSPDRPGRGLLGGAGAPAGSTLLPGHGARDQAHSSGPDAPARRAGAARGRGRTGGGDPRRTRAAGPGGGGAATPARGRGARTRARARAGARLHGDTSRARARCSPSSRRDPGPGRNGGGGGRGGGAAAQLRADAGPAGRLQGRASGVLHATSCGSWARCFRTNGGSRGDGSVRHRKGRTDHQASMSYGVQGARPSIGRHSRGDRMRGQSRTGSGRCPKTTPSMYLPIILASCAP